MKPVIVFILALLPLSCTSNMKKMGNGFFHTLDKKDYADHFASMHTDYVNSSNVGFIKLDRKSKKYLEKLYKKIISNDSLTLEQNIQPRFYIIDDKRNFFFSLPGESYFFSSGLFINYFKNEETLVSALVYEVIKSNKKIYKQRVIVPTGHLETEKMLELTRIPVKIKVKINEWSYFVMKEMNYDPSSILHWIQVQNRNYSDFALQNGKIQKVSEEESQFKQFIVKKGINLSKIDRRDGKLLREFYHLINYIKKKA